MRCIGSEIDVCREMEEKNIWKKCKDGRHQVSSRSRTEVRGCWCWASSPCWASRLAWWTPAWPTASWSCTPGGATWTGGQWVREFVLLEVVLVLPSLPGVFSAAWRRPVSMVRITHYSLLTTEFRLQTGHSFIRAISKCNSCKNLPFVALCNWKGRTVCNEFTLGSSGTVYLLLMLNNC